MVPRRAAAGDGTAVVRRPGVPTCVPAPPRREWPGVTPLETSLALIPAGYLIGTFPSATLVARLKGTDITRTGSGNPGASNAMRVLGWKLGLLVLAGDIGKGSVAAGIGSAVDGHRGAYILGLGAVLGHVFPVFRRFKGGRGVATTGGVLLVVFPVLGASLAATWFAFARLTHKASLASLVVAVAFPICVAIAHPHRPGDIVIAISLGALVIARHFANVRRLIRGEEHDLRGDTPAADGDSVPSA